MKKILVLTACIAAAAPLHAQTGAPTAQPSAPAAPMATESPFQASLTPNIAIYPQTAVIRGFAINVWGQNPQHGFNFGIVNGSTGESGGFSMAMVNYDDSYTGVQWGMVNYSKQSFTGWQEGWVNVSKGSFTGWQDGWVNVSDALHGLQSGVVNYTRNLHGVQIGVINVAMNNGWFDQFPHQLARGFPLVNWSF
ncbi:MAG: hypothetical protein KGJ88_13645 [Verrucomicrobiota bacterium]|nr:hypothetical protein [Verrucomicrobiota bacterium]